MTLTNAIVDAYNLSFGLAFILSFVGVLWCGSWGKLDLEQLAAHNKIEHDASLVHDNALPGSKWAPAPVSEKLLQGLLQYSISNEETPGGGLHLKDFAKLRAEREAELSSPLSAFHSKIGYGEAAFTWLVMQDPKGKVSTERMRQWYGEERFPDGWVKPTEPVTLKRTEEVVTKVKEIMQQIQMAGT